MVVLDEAHTLDVINDGFYDGLKLNSSIHNLTVYCGGNNIIGGVQKILKAYQENNDHLTVISIGRAGLQHGGDIVMAETLRRCTDLREFELFNCNVTDEQLLPMVDAIRGHRSMEKLFLYGNRIGNTGCETIATLLRDPNCNLHLLNLNASNINNEGVAILANSLANNTNLRELNLYRNRVDQGVVDIFVRVLCNTTSINDTYSSNHILENLSLQQRKGGHLHPLLRMNEGTNKSHVAIKKILKYHPNIDMEPLFEWNMEGEGERDLKALPFVVAWFDRAGEAVAGEEGGSYNIDERKLSAMYQFAKAMPLMFVPASHNKGGNNKRKRGSDGHFT